MSGPRPTSTGDDFRLIQFTPPGAGCSIQFGTNIILAASGSAQSLYLIVSGLEAVHAAREAAATALIAATVLAEF